MKRLFPITLVACLVFSSAAMAVDDLLDTYKQALASDPVFKSEEANLMATKEDLPISRANLLPTISANGSIARQYDKTDLLDDSNTFYNNTAAYSLNIDQPIFNYTNWMAVKNASALVKQEEATYFSSGQDLMLRTATAYFNILAAQDTLWLTRAQKKSLASLLRDTKQRYDVGLIPITNLYQVQARYDSVCASEIAAENDVSVKREKLREIIGKEPGDLAILAKKVTLIHPDPDNVGRWMAVAERQNYSLLASRYATLAANENIKMQAGGHIPTLDVTGGYQYSYDGNYNALGNMSRQRTATLGLTMNVPIYQGGMVSAKVRQASDQYQKASFDQETTYRTVISDTRQAFVSVLDAIHKTSAHAAAIVSNQSAYDAMLASYNYGTRTMTDVLDSQSYLYASENDHAQDQYNYIIQTLTLKKAAGTLGTSDLVLINKWLRKHDASDLDSKYVPVSAMREPQATTTQKVIKTAKKPVKSIKNISQKTTVSVSSSKKYILTLNPTHYVLQILASDNASKIAAFIKNHRVPVKMVYVSIGNGDQKVYKLIAGDYKTLSQAKVSGNKLSKMLGVSPWPRTVRSVQNELTN